MFQRAASFIDTFRLPAFPSPVDEKAFWQKHDERRLEFRKFFILIAIVVYSALGVLDPLTGGDATTLMLYIRVISILAIICIFYCFCQPSTPVGREIMISLIGIVVIASACIMTLIGPKEVASTYPLVISAAMIYGNCLLLPRFHTQAIFCIVVSALFWPSAILSEMTQHEFYMNVFVFLVTTVSVLVGALVREKLQREHAINEAKLSRARDEALRANRSKSHLLANVSHELRTPLNAIIGFSEMINNEVFGPIGHEKYRQYAHDIHFSGKLLHANINDLLDLSRLEVDKMNWREEYFSVTDMLESVITTCAPQNASIRFLLSPNFKQFNITMLGDPDRMSQVFINIINNAMKFSDADTAIRIAFDIDAAGFVTFSIADEGAGISKEDLDRVREPFSQANQNSYVASNTGLGLGLSIVSGIMERCNGTLNIESKQGVGTTVSIVIPPERIVVAPSRAPRGFTRMLTRQKAS